MSHRTETRTAEARGAAPAEASADALTLPLADIPEFTPHPVTIGRRALLLFRYGERVYATAARCTHQGVELLGGELEGALMRCPWHGVRFDVRTGARVNEPACRDLRTFRTEVRGGEVTVFNEAISRPTGGAA
ncbi:Rieske 2Fe-2S domain-containing protein [Streptomyces sp. JJ38]|uniref:Rieske (2Fe-2S) protein n=1 Tax=Streptomyces sp. JJ38 TaxID=2738128 RepID=UPI001C55BAD3|nr:Rieske 2Fe-2S domain-containing protein [Streptomyces sp. JJ38]MBW1596476.1 Rieske 2Fe-2S domain-containing protein [Streptomyces sp. JJ38]